MLERNSCYEKPEKKPWAGHHTLSSITWCGQDSVNWKSLLDCEAQKTNSEETETKNDGKGGGSDLKGKTIKTTGKSGLQVPSLWEVNPGL